jgi:hypothetical protein
MAKVCKFILHSLWHRERHNISLRKRSTSKQKFLICIVNRRVCQTIMLVSRTKGLQVKLSFSYQLNVKHSSLNHQFTRQTKIVFNYINISILFRIISSLLLKRKLEYNSLTHLCCMIFKTFLKKNCYEIEVKETREEKNIKNINNSNACPWICQCIALHLVGTHWTSIKSVYNEKKMK